MGIGLCSSLYRRRLRESSNLSLHVAEYRVAIDFQLKDFCVERLFLRYRGGTLRFRLNRDALLVSRNLGCS